MLSCLSKRETKRQRSRECSMSPGRYSAGGSRNTIRAAWSPRRLKDAETSVEAEPDAI